jgi:hypothetical protein
MVLVRDNEYEWWFMTDGRLMAPISAAFLYGYFLLDCWQKLLRCMLLPTKPVSQLSSHRINRIKVCHQRELVLV